MPNYEILLEQNVKLLKKVTINADTALDALKEAHERYGGENLSMKDDVERRECIKIHAVSVDKPPILTCKEEEAVEERLLNGACLGEGLSLLDSLMKNKEELKTVLKELNAMEEMAKDNDVYEIIADTALPAGFSVLLYDAIMAKVYIRLSDCKLFVKAEYPYVIEEEIGYLGGRTKTVCKDDIVRLFVEQWPTVKSKLERTLAETICQNKKPDNAPEARVYLVAGGGCKHLFHEGSKEYCHELCETYGWEYKDENEFVWRMELDELD